MPLQHPKISVVLRFESEASHETLANAISENVEKNYSAFSEKSNIYRSQFQLWEGDFADLPKEAEFLARTIGSICRKISEHRVVTCSREAEIAIFTHVDNQQVEIPYPVLEACVQAKVGMAVFFFRCAQTER